MLLCTRTHIPTNVLCSIYAYCRIFYFLHFLYGKQTNDRNDIHVTLYRHFHETMPKITLCKTINKLILHTINICKSLLSNRSFCFCNEEKWTFKVNNIFSKFASHYNFSDVISWNDRGIYI